jgi:hypothetical protein
LLSASLPRYWRVDGGAIRHSLDDAIGADENRLRYRPTKFGSGARVDHKLELRRLFDRQIGGGRALQEKIG